MDYDSEDAATGEMNYRKSGYNSGGRNGLGSKPLSSKSQLSYGKQKVTSRFSDDDDDDDDFRAYNQRNRTESPPMSSHRSDHLYSSSSAAAKPPSGRYNQTSFSGGGTNTSARSDYSTSGAKKSHLPALTYPNSKTMQKNTNDVDSDDSFMQRYNNFAKKPYTSDLHDDNNKFNQSTKLSSYNNNSRYDTYDEDDKRRRDLL
jgi:hypothetical protein